MSPICGAVAALGFLSRANRSGFNYKRHSFSMKSLLLSLLLVSAGSYAAAIPATYGTASHSTPYWQELATYDIHNNLVDQYGISWSTDGGSTWGREDLTVGDSVKFQFNMHKAHVGTHYADHLKAWLDWDQSGTFEAGEAIVYGKQDLPDLLGTDRAPAPGEANFQFMSDFFTIEESHIGSLWLRGRVVCSESLNRSLGGHWNDQWSRSDSYYEDGFNPTGHLHQGEVEEWEITVNPVPDAGSTLALLGVALVGLGFIKRRKAA